MEKTLGAVLKFPEQTPGYLSVEKEVLKKRVRARGSASDYVGRLLSAFIPIDSLCLTP
jgi:hypothetical protein